MKLLPAALVAFIGYGIFLQASELISSQSGEKFERKICEVVSSAKAEITIIYTFRNQREVQKSTMSMLEVTEHKNWNHLFRCVFQSPVIVRDFERFPIEPERSASSINIYFIESAGIMEEVMTFLNSKQSDKHLHHYVFIWLLDDISLLRISFERVWLKGILHAVSTIVNTEEIYTYEPFTPQGLQLRVLTKQPYFYDKLINFYHYKLGISMFTQKLRAFPITNYIENGYKGIDGRVAATLVKVLNATARYITPTDNDTYGDLINGTFTGVLKDMYSGLTHVGLNYRYVVDNVKPHFEELYPYQKCLLYLVVPAAKIKTQYLMFVYAFSNLLWLLLLLHFCLMYFIFIVVQKLAARLSNLKLSNRQGHWCWYNILEMLFKCIVAQNVEVFGRINSLRMLLISWILFSYLITCVYFSKLESIFLKPIYEAELNTLEDLSKLKAPIYTSSSTLQTIKVSLKPKYYEIIDGMSICFPSYLAAEEASSYESKKFKNIATILRNEIANEILDNTYNRLTNRPNYHIVKEYLRSFACSYYLTKGSPFAYKFQEIISYFHEFGFINHWLDDDFQQRELLRSSSESSQNQKYDVDPDVSTTLLPNKQVVLNLKILQGAFYLWLIGICISCFGFVFEWIYFWYEQRRVKGLIIED